MANRKRLTKDGFSRRAYDVENADPNSLNRVRHVPDAEEYMTWDPETHENHEKPDMRAEWKEDAEMRHPTLNVAMPGSKQANLALLRTAQTLAKKSSLAIKVAAALFPDGTDEFIEKQATDLMDLPLRSLVDTVARINKYAAEEAEMDAEEAEMDAEMGDGGVGMEMLPDAPLPADMPIGGMQEDWQKGGEPGESPPAQVPSAAVDLSQAAEVSAMGEVPPMDLEAPEAPEAEEGGDDLDLDLEMAGDEDEEVDGLGAAASDEEADDVDVDGDDQEMKLEAAIKASHTKTASKSTDSAAAKRGVKKIASAPRANGSALDVDSLSRLWKSDPDVSDHFSY